MASSAVDTSKLLADVVRSAFEHHKNHARFQETQRRWLNVTFITSTGATLYFLSINKRAVFDYAGLPTSIFWLCLAIHLSMAIWVSLITTKHSGECKRHTRRGDQVLDAVADLYLGTGTPPNETKTESDVTRLRALFDTLKLESSSDAITHKIRSRARTINHAAVISASRGTTYFYAAVVATDVLIAANWWEISRGREMYPFAGLILFCLILLIWSFVLNRFLKLVASAGLQTMSQTNDGESISDREAKDLGITTRHERMANGELRFRLRASDGTAYIRTESAPGSGWQRSHFHKGVLETYIVQAGRMVLVEWLEGKAIFRDFTESKIVTTRPGVPHNVYMFARSVTHTVKHGVSEGHTDWHSFPPLDSLTVNLTESEIDQKISESTRGS